MSGNEIQMSQFARRGILSYIMDTASR